LRRPPCLGAPAAFPAGRARHPQSAPGVHLRTGGFRSPIALPRPGGGVAARVASLARGRGAAGTAARRDPGPLWRRERPGPERCGAPRRAHPGARRGAARGGGGSGLLCWVCHLLSLPWGAAPLARRAGILRVGNDENAPALEMTLTGGEFAFEGPAVIALTGADFASS